MSRIKQVIAFSLFILLIVSCKSTQYVAPVSPLSVSASTVEQAYIDRYKDLAISEMKRSGIPASITLAQGMVESDYGRSTLAREANNHFGIKCHSDWNGSTIRHDDDKRNECFRKYGHAEESFRDHSDFLMSGSRYSFLFQLDQTDYKGWAKGLKQAGYATNPQYANMLIKKIDDLGLHQYDLALISRGKDVPREERVVEGKEIAEQVPAKANNALNGREASAIVENMPAVQAKTSRLQERNRIQYIIVKNGETMEMIEEEFELLKWELQRYNEFEEGYILEPGDIIYIQPKRNKADVGNETHVVKDGETLYSISQLYGVKKQKLMDYNMIQDADNVVVGDTIWLRQLKPVSR